MVYAPFFQIVETGVLYIKKGKYLMFLILGGTELGVSAMLWNKVSYIKWFFFLVKCCVYQVSAAALWVPQPKKAPDILKFLWEYSNVCYQYKLHQTHHTHYKVVHSFNTRSLYIHIFYKTGFSTVVVKSKYVKISVEWEMADIQSDSKSLEMYIPTRPHITLVETVVN